MNVRPATKSDISAIVRLLADDPLGTGRERFDDPLPQAYYDAFDAITKQAGNQVLVAVESEGVVGCLHLTFISKTLPPMVPIRFQIMLTSDVMNGAATLQDVLGRYELNCSCEDCAHCVRLVTEELIEKFGPEYEIPNLKKHFKCSRCGSPSGVVVHLAIIDRPIADEDVISYIRPRS
ncbi:MAG: hypothetical protein VB959_05605 [Rhodospirillales bacterium]